MTSRPPVRTRAVLAASALGVMTAALAPMAAASAATAPTTTVVAGGLDAPKYLTPTAHGLYVAESGSGGPHCVVGVANTSVTRVCAGASGAVARITGHRVRTLVHGLASASVASTHGVSGVTSVGFSNGRMALLFNDGGVGPTGVSGVARPYGARLGKLDLTSGRDGGPLTTVTDIAAFHATHPQSPAALGGVPGETLYGSDPHDMVAYRGGFAIADAAANDVVRVRASGRVSVLARIPTRPERAPAGALGPGTPPATIDAQAVPSSVTVGPDGALYVGLLRGAPSLPGTAEVDRVVPGGPPRPVVTGLTRVSDIAFDPRGRLDILESSAPGGPAGGALLRADLRGGTPATAADLGVRGLRSPVGLAVGASGTAYVTNDTTQPGRGEVVAVSGLDR